MRRPFVLLAALLIVAGAAGAAIYWYRSGTKQTAGQDNSPSVPVLTQQTASHPVPIYLRGVGTVIAFNNVVVRSQITGPLTSITFHQGKNVRKGDRLAEIDPRPFQAQLDQANANRDRDQAQVAN